MEKIIVRTSEEADLSRQKENADRVCPECECAISSKTEKVDTVLFIIPKRRYTEYVCLKCGCKWQINKRTR